MKKLTLLILMTMLSTSLALAEGGHGNHRGGGRDRGWGWEGGWIFPALIGGALIYDLTQPRTVYVQPQTTTIYLQPQPEPVVAPNAAPPSASYWYYCSATNAYYPYVTSCSAGWQTVPATPSSPNHN
jgi:hypothetical protein